MLWTLEDESKLLTIRSEDVDLKDTALGVAAKQMAAAVTQNMSELDADSRHKLLQSLAQFDRESPDGESDVVESRTISLVFRHESRTPAHS